MPSFCMQTSGNVELLMTDAVSGVTLLIIRLNPMTLTMNSTVRSTIRISRFRIYRTFSLKGFSPSVSVRTTES